MNKMFSPRSGSAPDVKSADWMIAIAVCAILSACGAKTDSTSSTSTTTTSTSTDTTASSTPPGSSTVAIDGSSSGTGAGTGTGTGTGTETGTETVAGSGSGTATSTSPQPNSGITSSGTDPLSTNGKVNINLNELSNDLPICLVAGNEIKVGDYKRMLRLQQIQANQAIIMNPQAKAQLLEESKKRNVSLTNEEKAKLLETAHQQKGQSPKEFQEFLNKTKSSEQQFDQEILQTGLAFKTSNMMIESALLPEMVNRELLAQASKEEGKEKEAMNHYLSFKHSKNFAQLEQATGLSSDALRDEIVKEEMAKLQVAKLQPQATVSDAEVRKTYNEHKNLFKHDERIKLASILIACPERDLGAITSVRSQVKAANPKLEGAQLDSAVAQVMEAAKQKALILLGQAKAGSDFAKLANENSNDPVTTSKKNGGDMGFVEKKNMIPQLADPIWKLKPGQTLDQVVKSELGYSIYKCTGREPAGYVKYEEVKPQLEALAKQAKLQQVVAKWLDSRRKLVKVEFTPKFMALANGGANTKTKTQ